MSSRGARRALASGKKSAVLTVVFVVATSVAVAVSSYAGASPWWHHHYHYGTTTTSVPATTTTAATTTTEAPSTTEAPPTTAAPTTAAPTTAAPTTAEPTTAAPTTAAPTTAAPTTAAPTTAEPTTAAPTTAEPTTAAPTTAAPTTAAPTTAAPTTAAPTTAAPTTAAPTTAAPTTTAPVSVGSYPASPTAVCGTSTLQSPYNSSNDPPLGTTTSVVTIPTGVDPGPYDTANTTYYFAPGLHTLGTTAYNQVDTGSNDWYVGEYAASAGGAVINGQEVNEFGFVNSGTTADSYEYLTVEGFTTYGLGGSELPSGGAAPDQTYAYITAEDNYPGSGLNLGTDSSLSYSCLTNNGDYGFNVYCNGSGCDASNLTTGPQDLVVEHDEVSYNDVCNWSGVPAAYWPGPSSLPSGCGSVAGTCFGCSGGVKFWATDGTVVDDNYVHNNYDVGVWYDTDNDGATIEGNYISNNFGEGVMYELSYNALIEDNNFVDNAWALGACGAGSGNPCDVAGNLAAAIYVSESGGNTNVEGNAGIGTLTISGNAFTDNWDGVFLSESANRFAGSPDNTSAGYSTIGPNVPDSSGATYAPYFSGSGSAPAATYYDNSGSSSGGCGQADLTGATAGGSPDYYDNCDWRTQNVSVSGNTFNFDAADIPGCSPSSTTLCGYNGLTSVVATAPSWNPYISTPGGTPGASVIDRVSNCRSGSVDTIDLTYTGCVAQNNWFSANTYNHTGSQNWGFDFANQGTEVTASQWQGYGQDTGSTFN